MEELSYLFIAVLLQLVAVPTLTTPSPLSRNEDEFADQLKTLQEASEDLQKLADELDIYKQLEEITKDDSNREVIDGIKEMAGLDDEFEPHDLVDLVNELVNEPDEEVEDELKNLSDPGDGGQTGGPADDLDIDGKPGNKDENNNEDDDAVGEELMKLAGRNESTTKGISPLSDAPITATSRTTPEDNEDPKAGSMASIDSLIQDLMDAAAAEDQHDDNINIPMITEEDALAAGDHDVDGDRDDDYLLVTEIDTVTELIYDAVPEDDDNEGGDMNGDVLGVSVPSTEGGETLTSMAVDDIADLIDVTEANDVIDATAVTEISTEFEVVTKLDEVTDATLVTEIVTELETDPVDVITADNIVNELRDLVRAGEEDNVDDDGGMDVTVVMTTQSTPSEDDGLEQELEDLGNLSEDLRTAEGGISDDDEPTFVFTTPYPATLGSTEMLDLGPDLTTATTKRHVKECRDGHYACADGSQCVVQDTLCDLMMDCEDGSDEDPDICKRDRECPEGYVRCGQSPQCVREGDWCDGVFHCYNGADERSCMSCVGVKGELKYLMMEDFCDGVQDCEDNHDETAERCWNPCPAGFSKCADEHQCIKDKLVCDGFKNCRDGSDEGKSCARTEVECERFSMFACDGICMIKSALCDETPDCKDGVDEKGCTKGIFSCPGDFVLSRKTNNCVHKSIAEP